MSQDEKTSSSKLFVLQFSWSESLELSKLLEEGGLMDQWNQSYPDQAVQPGDRFAEAGDRFVFLQRSCNKQ